MNLNSDEVKSSGSTGNWDGIPEKYKLTDSARFAKASLRSSTSEYDICIQFLW